MKEKVKNLFVSIIISGIILFIIGMYFTFIKAGLPYLDPTTEMTIRWNAYYYAGETCMLTGVLTVACGLIGRIICRFIK